MNFFWLFLLANVFLLAGCGQSVEEAVDETPEDFNAPRLTEMTPVAAVTVDLTPHYTFKSTEVGTVSYKNCKSSNTKAQVGLNTVRFELTPDTYKNCKITVTDAAGNKSQDLNVSEFTIKPDSSAPVLTEVKPVAVSDIDTSPSYKFQSNEAGALTYLGDCSSTTTNAIVGINTITFSTFTNQAVGTHSNCKIRVTDNNSNATVLNVSSFTIVKMQPLNDTGIKFCGDYANLSDVELFSGIYQNNIVCQTSKQGISSVSNDGIVGQKDPVPVGQDAVYGRDQKFFAAALTKTGGGNAGFDFTKLDSKGIALAKQKVAYDEATGTEVAGSKWTCIKDNVTGLIWEVKSDDNGLRDKDNVFDFSVDASVYLNNINSANICGETANDWRLPSAEELLSIVNYAQVSPSIDANYFPNTLSQAFWTADVDFSNPDFAWVVAFDHGFESTIPVSIKSGIRLVR